MSVMRAADVARAEQEPQVLLERVPLQVQGAPRQGKEAAATRGGAFCRSRQWRRVAYAVRAQRLLQRLASAFARHWPQQSRMGAQVRRRLDCECKLHKGRLIFIVVLGVPLMQVDDVCSWVTSLDPKVAAYAQAFREQEIDGVSLRELEQVYIAVCLLDALSSHSL